MEPFSFDKSAGALVRHLFPFYFLVDRDLTVVDTGANLRGWLGYEIAGHRLPSNFTIHRPGGIDWSYAKIAARSNDVFSILTGDELRQLRGQMVPLVDEMLLFVGSPVVRSTDKLEDLGLSLRDLKPHDATADIIILSQFSSMQIRDIERKSAELSAALVERDVFSEQARTDALTGLLNRHGFWTYWEEVVDFDAEDSALLVYLDMDNFKAVNDDHGHIAGDLVLQTIGSRLSAAIRHEDVAARLGGDEFVIILNNIKVAERHAAVDRVVGLVNESVPTGNGLVDISFSVGVAVVESAGTISQLLNAADTAMYEGRTLGSGRVTWFDESMGLERERERLLTNDLRVALAKGDINVAYQPIVHLESQRVVSFEALSRWTHPYLGAIAPDIFIELAERAGLVKDLDMAVLTESMQTLKQWRQTHPQLHMNVNLSGLSITEDLPDRVARVLADAGCDRDALRVEVTESRSISKAQVSVLEDLISLGIRLDLDDFGTGYSSLSHIQALPIYGLKIDRSFIAKLGESHKDRELVAATISMANSLGLTVVAEGIEDNETESMLMDLGCLLGQGYLYSKPLPVDEAFAFLADWELTGSNTTV